VKGYLFDNVQASEVSKLRDYMEVKYGQEIILIMPSF
jgi:hypothetical protein